MATNVNKIKNADFSRGVKTPTSWTWTGTPKGASWERTKATKTANASMQLDCTRPGGRALWSQTVVCKPEEFYRIDAVVTANATVTDVRGGVVVVIEALEDGEVVDVRSTPGIHQAETPETVRAFYLVPENVRRLRISIGLVDAFGKADLHTMRFIEMIEPDELSHPLAVPPPPHEVPAPLVAKSVCVCSVTAADRRVSRLLGQALGERTVSGIAPAAFKPTTASSDAILFPDDVLPRSIRSVKALAKLAESRIVVVSLPAFCAVAGEDVSFRRVEQADDPINGKIMWGCYASRGFALHDVFPYAWDGKAEASYAHHQFRGGKKFKEFCKKQKFEVFLDAMCDKDSTSDQPMALYRETEGGALFVLDIDPVEAIGTTMNEPALAMHLLLSVLGHSQHNLGQFASPTYKEQYLRDSIREMAVRIESIHVLDEDLPSDQITEQLVLVGSEDQSFGLPLEPKPVILVRSGLQSGDAESIHGAWTWFKQLVRPAPFPCPYAEAIASAFRFAWVPSAAPLEQRAGLLRTNRDPIAELAIDTDDGELAMMIDLVSRSCNRIRVCFAEHSDEFERYATQLPQLFSAFRPGNFFLPTVGPGGDFGDRAAYEWRHVQTPVEVVVDPAAFDAPEYASMRDANVNVVRIEVPGCDADFAACSIHRTDIAATTLEHVIGLQYGLIGVNRTDAPIRFDGFAPIAPGEAIIARADGSAILQASATAS